MVYDIYEEGYAATGQSGKARYIGTASGTDFLDACKNYIAETGYGEILKDRYGNEYACEWGCKWYPSLLEAQSTFG